MSFMDEIKNEISQEQKQDREAGQPASPDRDGRMQAFIREELSALQDIIRQDAKQGRYETNGEKHLFRGVRLWHEGDYRQGTRYLSSFYPFLSKDTILEKEILDQSKRLLFGYHYEVRYSLTKEGASYYQSFSEAMAKEGILVGSLFVEKEDGSSVPLPYTASGNVRYDFELEHHLSDYPRLCYSWQMEVS
ncbi:MAG: hypothetical protein Q4C65_07870 [Eubacteriales bacterium]|nr:hypothetical protein [Eubacteriales bacterium]